jgi:DNA-binding transcriptional MerR regulator
MKATTMMGGLNKQQTIGLITALGVGIAGIIALLEYVNTKKHRQLQQKNAELENQIKQLQLIKLTSDLDGFN